MKDIEYQVVQAIAGRMRIRVPWLKTSEDAAGKLQRLVESLNYVTSVRINPLAQSIIVLYRASAVSPKELEAQVAAAIQQVNPAPTSPVSPEPFSETSSFPAVTPPTPTPTATPVVVKPSSPVASELTATHSPAQKPASQPAIEIPSPWDDHPNEPEVEAPWESHAAVAEASSQPKQEVPKPAPIAPKPSATEAEASHQLHSTASLAKRLNTTSQAITHRRHRADFPTWTQSQDPERIAWKYDAAARTFGPADSLEATEVTTSSTIAPKHPEKTVEPPVVDATQSAAEAAEPASPKSAKPRKTTRKSNQSGKRRSSTKR